MSSQGAQSGAPLPPEVQTVEERTNNFEWTASITTVQNGGAEEAANYRQWFEEAEQERRFQVHDLRAQLQLAEADEGKLRETIAKLEEEYNDRIVQHQQTYQTLTTQNQHLANQVNRFLRELKLERDRRLREEEERKYIQAQLEERVALEHKTAEEAEDQVARMKQRDQESERAKGTLTSEVEELKSKVSHLQKKLEESEKNQRVNLDHAEKNHSLKSAAELERQKLQDDLDSLTFRMNAESESATMEKSKLVLQITEINEQLQLVSAEKSRQIEEFTDTVSALQQEKEEVARRLEGLQRDYDAVKAQVEQQSDKISTYSAMRDEFQKLSQQLTDLEHRRESLTTECESLKMRNRELSEAEAQTRPLLEEYKEKHTTLTQQIVTQRSNYAFRIRALEQSRGELLAQLQRQQEEERASHSNTQQELQQLTEINRSKDLALDKMAIEMAAAKELAQEAAQHLLNSEERQKDFEKILSTMQSEYSKEMDELHTEVTNLQQQALAYHRQNCSLEEENKTLSAGLARAQGDLRSVREQRDTLDSDIISIRAERDAMREKCRTMETQYEEERRMHTQTLESRIAAAHKETDNRNQVIADYKAQLEVQQQQNQSLLQENRQLSTVVAKATATFRARGLDSQRTSV